MSLNARTLKRFLVNRAGLEFDQDKLWLAESRLAPLAERHGLPNIDALIGQIASGLDPALDCETLEAMLTHETLFFRDRVPFEQFRLHMLPKLLAERADKRHIRIWSAACSTGQEPYSLAMLLDEEGKKLNGWRVEIIATDLSRGAIETARTGRYSQFEVQRGVPITYLLRHFERDGDNWQLREPVRSRVEFRQHNLIDDFSGLGKFDIIFCRNVLTYFDATTKKSALERLRLALNPGGFLVLGAFETALALAPDLHPLPFQTAIVTKVPATGA
ncbi:MAG: protein-glutamate O-methyltransferase CheR [Hyphomicrobiales bacterium]|nr:protein-glutamate O-methyltransferase CheR [Hyphomicrobiales bacterium]MDE2114348.1 protein-glutamate O-methyltransferase CheR [Hyphomicrobiales bacterium]